MKNKLFQRKMRKEDEFRVFKNRIFFRTVLLAVLAILCIRALYSFIFYGNFANMVVALYQKIFQLSYDESLDLYQWTFTESGGAGLGLAIAKEIIELHHGTITARSEEDVIEFVVTLPLL